MSKIFFIIVVTGLLLLIDIYVYQAIRVVTGRLEDRWQRIIKYTFWSFTAICLLGFFYYQFTSIERVHSGPRMIIATSLFVIYFSKVFTILFVLSDDLRRGAILGYHKIASFFNYGSAAGTSGYGISRSEFLAKAGLIAAAVPAISMSYGIISGAHDYRIIRKQVKLPNLPSSFHGMKIAQISDIHSGSFYNKIAVKGGVEMILEEKPDLAFFTGDLVNNRASEMRGYMEIFEKIKAPLGVYSTLGNHDYGNYVDWQNESAKEENLKDIKNIHKNMGWQMLNNENRIITQGGDKIAVIGVENWGSSDWQPKLGDIAKAKEGTEEAAVKLLLSHDPSHWSSQVTTENKDIDITFSGHTHGMQFGIEIGELVKWSPAQYYYEHWAGLYEEQQQYLYVNRGYGYIGFPGRIGMPPEITIIELLKA